MKPAGAWTSMLLVAAAGWVAGCQNDFAALQTELQQLRQQAEKQKEESEFLKAEIQDKQKLIDTLRALGADKRLEKLYLVKTLEMGRFTGGVSTDGKDGDNAIKVYLEPTDQTGSVIKAAGSVTVQLYDLAAPPNENLLRQFTYDVDEVAKHWYGGFGAYHYSFECSWGSPPSHEELTVRVEFIDYLTGRTFSAQTVCKIKPRPTTQPTQPATTQATRNGG